MTDEEIADLIRRVKTARWQSAEAWKRLSDLEKETEAARQHAYSTRRAYEAIKQELDIEIDKACEPPPEPTERPIRLRDEKPKKDKRS